MNNSFLRWTCIGLLIRFLIMPFSFHGHDLFMIYYFPFKWLSLGQWDPYSPMSSNPYYPPAAFFMMSFFLFLTKPLLPHLSSLFALFEKWNFTWEGNTIHYAELFSDHFLFRTLFLFKIPLLLFDCAIAYLLLKIFPSGDKKALLGYKVWMLNPVLLHSGYALGQIDIILTFFILLSVMFMIQHRAYLSLSSLAIASFIKTFPLLLIPFVIHLLTPSFKEKIKMSLFIIGLFLCMILPFYFSSGSAVIHSILFSATSIPLLKMILFSFSYILSFLFFFFFLRRKNLNLYFTILILMIPMILFFSFHTVTLRFFILLTPFLIYAALHNKYFWIYSLILFISLFILRTGDNTVRWGLFAALDPTFFSSLPIFDSYANLLLPFKMVRQFMYKVFVLTGVTMVIHIFYLLTKAHILEWKLNFTK